VLARWITGLLLVFLPQNDRSYLQFQPNTTLLAFTALVTLATGLICGLLPAVQASSGSPGTTLKSTTQGLSGGRRGIIARFALVAQLAVSLVLVIGAGLFARSLGRLNNSTGGFERRGLILAKVNPEKAGYQKPQLARFYRELLERLNSTPEIASAALSVISPLSGDAWWDPAIVPGYIPAPNELTTTYMNEVGPRYFETMKIPFVAGRDFQQRDQVNGAKRVAIVNESFARRFLAGKNPIGVKFSVGGERDFEDAEIVGVVKDAKYLSVRDTEKDLAYAPLASDNGGTIVVRPSTGLSAAVCAAAIRQAVASAGKDVPVLTHELEEDVQRSFQRDQLITRLSAAFGALGLVLASIGLYGVMAYAVSGRTREIGVRMALGAEPGQVLWMVLRETIGLTAIGILIGVPFGIMASRLIASQLFGVSPWDPLTIGLSVSVLATAALLAGYIPARRATKIDPIRALRYE
jgi:predicted permease